MNRLAVLLLLLGTAAAQITQQSMTSGGMTVALQPTVTVVITAPSSPLTTATQGSAITPITFTCSGGTAPYTISNPGGGLPAGITLSSPTLSGTPTQSGTFNFNMRCTDTNGVQSALTPYSWVVNAAAALTIQTSPAPSNGVTGGTYNFIVGITGGVQPYQGIAGSPQGCNVTLGALPGGINSDIDPTGTAGCVLSTNGGAISATAGTYNFTLNACDAVATCVTASLSITIQSASACGPPNYNCAYKAVDNRNGGVISGVPYLGSAAINANCQSSVFDNGGPGAMLTKCGAVLGVGASANDPDFGTQITRATDALSDTFTRAGSSWFMESSGGMNQRSISCNENFIQVAAPGGGPSRILSIDPVGKRIGKFLWLGLDVGISASGSYDGGGACTQANLGNCYVDKQVTFSTQCDSSSATVPDHTFYTIAGLNGFQIWKYTIPSSCDYPSTNCAAPTATLWHDFNSDSFFPAGTTATWSSESGITSDEDVFVYSISITGGQGTGTEVLAYSSSHNAAKHLNTHTMQITVAGSWGTSGSAVFDTGGIDTDRFTLHEATTFMAADPVTGHHYAIIVGQGCQLKTPGPGAVDWAQGAIAQYAIIAPTVGNTSKYNFQALNAGTEGVTEPAWDTLTTGKTAGQNITDAYGVTWMWDVDSNVIGATNHGGHYTQGAHYAIFSKGINLGFDSQAVSAAGTNIPVTPTPNTCTGPPPYGASCGGHASWNNNNNFWGIGLDKIPFIWS